MRVFISLRRISVLFMLLLAMPGALPAMASAQSSDICADAIASAQSGTGPYANYEIVYGSGGSGSQIVLGTDESETLTGGSGDDVLCGYGGADTLEGGSGNDILVGGDGIDALYAGSGNDTLYGTEDEVLDEGSGQDETIAVTLVGADCEFAQSYDSETNPLNLANLHLSYCDLSDMRLEGVDLSGSILDHANLSSSWLTEANFAGADLRNANLSGAGLANANLFGADLTDANLNGAILSWATCPDGSSTESGCEGHLTLP